MNVLLVCGSVLLLITLQLPVTSYSLTNNNLQISSACKTGQTWKNSNKKISDQKKIGFC